MADTLTGQLRLRVQFTKEGRARYLSHSEYTRTLMIAARRAGLPLEYAGQNMSRMKVSLSPPLPIGITSECEFMDFSLTSYVPAAEAQRLLEGALPEGIRAVQARLMGTDARPVGKTIDTAAFAVELPAEGASEGEMSRAVKEFLEKETIPYERVQPRRTRVVDVRAGVHRLELARADEKIDGGQSLTMALDDGIAGTTKPWEVIEVLAEMASVPRETWERATVHRTGLFARRGDRMVSPMDLGRRTAAAGRGTRGGKY
ncbi:MAG: TIGR03936 family radical SAM-associated protein [Candidatus Geothermincolia bacterium]